MTEVWLAEDKSFLITGGANGLGAEYVEAFLKEGAKNIAILDIADETGEALSKKLNDIYGNKTIFVKCDVSQEEDINLAFQKVLKEFKQIDVIINNAGVMSDAENVWRRACDINWQGVASFTRKGISHMRKDEGGAGGTIINISSIAGFLKLPFIPAYAGSKAAVLHFSISLAKPPFYEKTSVRILTMCFGPTRTPLMQGLAEKSIDTELASNHEKKTSFNDYQLVESAVNATVEMFRVGYNGSVWLAANNRPVEDITHIINRNHDKLLNIVLNGLGATNANVLI